MTDPATVALPTGPFRMFTFGPIHTTLHGIRRDACVIFEGEGEVPRARMHQRFSNEWAMDYGPDRAQEQIDQWGYVPLTLAELPPVRTDLSPEVYQWIHQVLAKHGEPLFAKGTPEYTAYHDALKTELAAWVDLMGNAMDALVTSDVPYRVISTGDVFRDDGSRVWPADKDFAAAMASVHTSWCRMAWNHPAGCKRIADRTDAARDELTATRANSTSIRRGEDAARTLYVRGGAVPRLENGLVYPGESADEVRAAIRAYARWLTDLADRA